MRIVARMVWWSVLLCLGGLVFGRQGLANAEPASNIQPAKNILLDSSFEETKPRDQFGLVFKHWGGWKYEGECEFRVGQIARSGKTSCLLYGGHQPKIRVRYRHKELPAGRYRITGYIRGLDIGEGMWRATTEFAFDDKYFQLKKNGTFGWTPVTYVVEIKQPRTDVGGPSFGLMAPGYLWIDDVTMVPVGEDVPLTPVPIVGEEESPIVPPGPLGDKPVRCPECAYRNNPAWQRCYACGTLLQAAPQAVTGPPVRLLTSFEDKSPFSGGTVVQQHVTDGKNALRIDRSYVVWNAPLDFSGYDYLKADLYADTDSPLELYVEIRDQQTTGYWTRVNYITVVPPGRSTLVLPLGQLYVGEKSRPGRPLILSAITHFVLNIGDKPAGPLFVDNLRLERDVETPQMMFEGLWAFDFGPAQSPLMPGFTRIDASTVYSVGRGYGLKDAKIWRSFDALQPDPLYQDFICIESGGLAVDVPNGRYHVVVNVDSPSGFWGEYQVFRSREIRAEGKPVVKESMDFDRLKQKYFRFWDTEDSPEDDTFDKYQRAYFQEKQFEVEVGDGQLNLEFLGENWANCVSAVIIFPTEKQTQGQRFVDYVVQRRRFFFDNYFRRVLHKPTGDPIEPSPEETARGYIVFTRDYMQDVYYNDTPRREEVNRPVTGFGFAGEWEPLTLAIYPLKDLGPVTVTASDLRLEKAIEQRAGAERGNAIPRSCIDVGYVSNRLTRVTAEGSVYTIAPRLIISGKPVEVKKGVARRFWLTIRPPDDTPPGVYRGEITINPQHGKPVTVPVEYRVYKGVLDEADIPVGPWGHEIRIPWSESDPHTQAWNDTMTRKSLRRLRDYGFTTFSGLPRIRYEGFKNGRPQLDFTIADRQMRLAREMGFSMPVVNYVHILGFNLYYQNEAAMRQAGFSDYSEFVRAIFTAIQKHAEQENWLPVYWNLADEPIGDNLLRSIDNARAYRKAFPSGPPWFTGATSFASGKADDPHFALATALHVANLNTHSEESVRMIQQAGGQWAFYNGGNRWTFGTYMYKAAKQFDMKFRLSWHWNVVAGDPYYALDCREDDYAWCNSNPDGELVPSLHFERDMREGLDDYRYLLTLARLAKEKNDAQAQQLIQQRLDSFRLGQRDHDKLFPVSDWSEFRRQVAEHIERLRMMP